MMNMEATSSLQSIAASNKEPSSDALVESCPDPACAPTAASSTVGASIKDTCAASNSAPSASSETMHRLLTTVSSDESAAELASVSPDDPAVKGGKVPPVVNQPSSALSTSHNTTDTTTTKNIDAVPEKASAPKDNHLMKKCLPRVVHRPSASTSTKEDVVGAPSTSQNTTDTATKSSCGVATAVSSYDATTEKASAPKDNHLVMKCLPRVVHRPSASNDEDGIVSAPGKTTHDASSVTDISTVASSKQSTKVAMKKVQPDAPVSGEEVARASHHLVNTPEATSSRVLTAIPPTIEVGGLITKRLRSASIVAAPAEMNAIENALAKKRKSEAEEQLTKKKVKVLKDPHAPKKNMTAYYATYARAWIKSRNPNAAIATEVTKAVKDGWKDISDHGRLYWNEQAIGDKARYEKELAEYKNSELDKVWQAYVAAEESKQEQATSNSAIDVNEGKKQAEDPTSSAKPAESVFMNYESTIDTNGKMKQAEDSTAPKPKPPKPYQGDTPYGSAYMHYSAYARAWVKSRNPSVTNTEVEKTVRDGWSDMNEQEHRYWFGIATADKVRYQQELALFKARF